MHNHYTVTIHDENGVRQFNVHKLVKKAIVYLLSLVAIFTIFGTGSILYLNSTLKNIEVKRTKLEKKYEEASKNLHTMENSLQKKRDELDELSSSLLEIENLIGISSDENSTLQERVNTTKLSSEEMAVMFKFIPNGSPVVYNGITSKFGYRMHPTLHKREFHPGTDLKAKMNTPVYATADGIVEWAAFHKRSGYGRLIIIEHNYGFKTYFGHLHKIVVKPGHFVKKGDLIAYTGSSGLSSGPHIHYEIRYMGRAVNPYWFIKWNVKNYKEIFNKERKIPWKTLIAVTSQIKISKTGR